MESALYGIYALVVFVSEISLVRYAHSFDFWYKNNSCVNTTVGQHFPWSILYIQLLYSTCQWGDQNNWLFFTSRLDNCSVKSKRWLTWRHDPVAESASKCFSFTLWHKDDWRFQLICVGTLQLGPWLQSIDGGKSLYCTLSEVHIIFSLLTFFINALCYMSNPTSTLLLPELVTLSDHMKHSSRGDLQLLQDCHFIGTASYVLWWELSQKCHPSTRESTRSLLRTLCTAFSLAFFTGSK